MKTLIPVCFNPTLTFDLALDCLLEKNLILTAVDYLIATSFPASPSTDLRKMSTPVHWHPISSSQLVSIS